MRPCPPARGEQKRKESSRRRCTRRRFAGVPPRSSTRPGARTRAPRLSAPTSSISSTIFHCEKINGRLPLARTSESSDRSARVLPPPKRLRRQTQITQLPARRGVAAQVVQIHVRVRVVEHVRPDAVQGASYPNTPLLWHTRAMRSRSASEYRAARAAGGWRFCAAERRAVASFSLRRRTPAVRRKSHER